MDKKKFTLTIPVELLEQIKKIADKKGMSINEYIILSLNQELKKS